MAAEPDVVVAAISSTSFPAVLAMNRSPAASTATPVGRLRAELVAAFAPDPPGNTAAVGPQVPVPATVEIWLTDGTIFRTTQLPVSTAYSSPWPPMAKPLG